MIAHNSLNSKLFSINCKGTLLSLQTPVVIGILNTTPDSFFDGGKYNTEDSALFHAEKMLNEGAVILDIGGYSSRPGAIDISVDEELKRVISIIERISLTFPQAIISIDTFRAKVAMDAINAGASIVNDISAGDDDALMIETVAKLGVPYIAMHKKGTPQTMQLNPAYNDVTVEVLDYFIKKIPLLRQAGIVDIIIDPGFGFGKNLEHNYNLLKNLLALKILNCPILAGMSRKRMINEVLNISAKDALNGTTVVNTIALMNGANILRVHDVKEAVEAVKIIMSYKNLNAEILLN
ncbi:MAG: dihydropteroate synthase [Bacteroidia bacterium]